MKRFLSFFKVIFFVGLLFSILIFNSYAEKAQSSNYKIVTDSLNNAGGDSQVSSSGYKMKDTVGEMGTGESASSNYKLRAGYRQMDNAFYISINTPTDVNLGTLSGFTGGTATGALTWAVITDNPAGYNLSVKAGTAPALGTGTYNIADYTPVGGTTTPDYNWSIGSAASEFGFAPYNSNSQVSKFKNNGSSCNNSSTITDLKCWFGFATSDTQVANRVSSTTGENTKINLQVQIDTANGYQEDGTYTATITATATAN